MKNSPHDVQTKGGGGVKGLLNNFQKTALFLRDGFPYGDYYKGDNDYYYAYDGYYNAYNGYYNGDNDYHLVTMIITMLTMIIIYSTE